MARREKLKRKVYPYEVGHGGTSSNAGKWAAIFFAVLAALILLGITLVSNKLTYEEFELAGTPKLTSSSVEGLCMVEARLPIRNKENEPLTVTQVDLTFGGTRYPKVVNRVFAPNEVAEVTIEVIAEGVCAAETWTGRGERVSLNFTREGDPDNLGASNLTLEG